MNKISMVKIISSLLFSTTLICGCGGSDTTEAPATNPPVVLADVSMKRLCLLAHLILIKFMFLEYMYSAF